MSCGVTAVTEWPSRRGTVARCAIAVTVPTVPRPRRASPSGVAGTGAGEPGEPGGIVTAGARAPRGAAVGGGGGGLGWRVRGPQVGGDAGAWRGTPAGLA